MLVIILFILILNVVSILLMYKSLNNRTSKEKLLFIVIGIAVMYILTSIVYWISTKNIEITEVSDYGKDLIIFLFVPINGIIILPLLARSYCKYKDGGISSTILRNRGVVFGIILLILLIIECAYFENIQNQVVKMITSNNKVKLEQEVNLNAVETNNINTNESNLIPNQIEVDTTNEINENKSSNIINETVNASE